VKQTIKNMYDFTLVARAKSLY